MSVQKTGSATANKPQKSLRELAWNSFISDLKRNGIRISRNEMDGISYRAYVTASIGTVAKVVNKHVNKLGMQVFILDREQTEKRSIMIQNYKTLPAGDLNVFSREKCE
jgi:hypothetical protein